MNHLVVRLGIKDLETRLGADRSTIWRWYRAGKFPEPHYIGDRRLWLLSDVEAWEAAQVTRKASERRGAKNFSGRQKGRTPPAAVGRDQ